MTNPVIQEIEKLSKSFGSRRAVALHIGVSAQYLSDVFKKRRPVSDELAAKLGWEKVINWRKINKISIKPRTGVAS